MLYQTLVNISNIPEDEVSVFRESIKKHFTEKVNLKRKESVLAKYVLCVMLKEKFGLSEYIIDSDEKGKPYLSGGDICFNLSHSGDYVLCTAGDEQVGCDIQEIKKYNEKIAKRFFTEKEYEALEKSESKESDFTKLWTLKESVLKYQGDGISGGLDAFDFSDCLKEDNFSLYGLQFHVTAFQGYVISVCSKSGDILPYAIDPLLSDKD